MARRTALLYALAAGVWILFSDRLLMGWVHDRVLLTEISVVKGYFFVAVTALLIYAALKVQLRRHEEDTAAWLQTGAQLESERRFLADVIENSGSLVFAKDREGRYRLVNQTWERVTGHQRANVLGRTDAEVFPSPAGESFRQNDLDVMAAGQSRTFEEFLTDASGTRTFISVRFPTRDPAGEITGICGMSTEITEQKRADERLRRSEEHFRLMVEQAGEGIFICEPDGHCLSANKAGCEMIGYTEEEMRGMTFADVTLQDDLPRLQRETMHVLSGGVLQTEWRVRRKDGSVFTCEANSKLRSDGRLQIFVRDVTEREAAARRQAQLQRTIRTISEANSTIVRATSEEQLLNDFCERMVQQTGHRVIWVGFVDPKTKEVRIVAKAGPAIEYLDGIRVTADEDEPSGRGPTGVCIRSGQVVNCRSFARNAEFAPWQERAERCGLRCSISLPLRVDGQVIGAFTLYSDVEDRFDDEEERLLGELAADLSYALGALRHERWMRIISHAVEHSPATVVITNSEGNIEYVNLKFTELTGYTAEEVLGQNSRMLKSGELPADVYRELWQTIKAGGEWRGEFHNVKKNGELYWETAWISAVPDAQGRITRFIAIKEDITARKEAEERMKRQLARMDLLNQIVRAIGERTDLETILFVVACSLEEHLPVDFSALCLADDDGKKLTITALGHRSEELAAVAGLDEGTRLAIMSEGIERCTHGKLIDEPDLASPIGPLATMLARAGLGSAVMAPLAMKEQVFGVLMVARRQPHSFSSPDCEFLRQLGEQVALAIHQVRLNLDLQRANDELRETYATAVQQERLRALGQMASGVAHDINNAISPVSIYCDLLQQTEPNLSEEAKDFLKTIQNSIQDVAGTVSRLREFYRQREEQTELFPVALNHVAKEVVKLTRARWVDMPQERGIVIDMDLQLATGLPDVPGVESEIREALINLVFNGVDAMSQGGKLTIRTGLTDEVPNRVFVEIADTGAGMDEETRRRCLEPFFSTKGDRGTGLGLAMVCGVAQRHDAEITIESELGRGTTMRLSFPVPKEALLKRESAATPRTVPKLKVLIVDDDPLITRAMDFGLQVDGHTVATASGGQEGIDRFNEALAKGEPFQAVITDLGMPHVDGRQVAAAVKAAAPSTPVILLTGWGQRLIDAGENPENVDRVLSKPPRLREVREALAACCPPKPAV